MKLDLLELPKQLEGKWKNAVFLSYGVDILFFERVIWQTKWQNIAIIGDGIRLSDALQGYEGRDEIRWTNRKYVVDGVYGTTFHPKMILLTNQDSGRLFIGSGNLGFSGYASGGEMFVQYDYDSEHTEYLSAFGFARSFLDELIEEHYLRPRTEKHLIKVFQDSPWLYRGSASGTELVRSNLERSFFEQFIEKLNQEPIDELLILAPFYDEKLIALSRMINQLNPKSTVIFLQEGQTSIDPIVLEKLIQQSSNKIAIKLIEMGDDNAYVHNKLFVAKTENRAVCLQGSPNLSISAFIMTPPEGNFELANLLEGKRDKFDSLFTRFLVQDLSTPINQLNLKYIGSVEDEVKNAYESTPFWVLGAEWQNDLLTIFYKGKIEALNQIAIELAEVQYPLKVINIDKRSIETKIIVDEVLNLLTGYSIIHFIFDGVYKSAPVIPFSIKELDNSIKASNDGEHLSDLGDLDLDDKDFEELLYELDGSLIIDGKSVVKIWRTDDHEEKDIDWEDQTAVRMAYEEIDYDLLRSHPKLEQYRTWNLGSGSYRKTELQIILSSITSHFQGLVDTASGKQDVSLIDRDHDFELSGVDQEDSREVEEEEAEREEQRRKGSARKRNIMKAFIRRYLKGISSAEFLRIVDHDVIANNYVIFSHILWRLFSFDWMDDEFIAKSALEMMYFVWGDGNSRKGYFHSVDEQGRVLCADIIEKNQGVGRLIATIYYINYLVIQSNEKELRLVLRNLLRHFLVSSPLDINLEMIVESWLLLGQIFIDNPPSPSEIIIELEVLAYWETQESFLRNIENTVGIGKDRCRFSAYPVSVMRPAVGETVQIRQLEFLDPTGIDTPELAETVCKLWMNYQPMNFYRIADNHGKIQFLYDREYHKGLYVNREKGIDVDIEDLFPFRHRILDNRFSDLKEIAMQAEEKIEVRDISVIKVEDNIL